MISAPPLLDPFPLTADPRGYVPRAASESALRALERALSESKCGILTGPPGVGKTTLLHVLGSRLRKDFWAVYVPNGSLDLDDVCRWVLAMLGAPIGESPRESFLELARRLGETGRRLLLLLDDASAPAFAAARSLVTRSGGEGAAVRLVLVPAKAGAASKLAEALGARSARVDLSEPMSAAETAELVNRRLSSSAVPEDVRARFDPATIERIHRAASGNPRLVGLVASEVLWPGRPGEGVSELLPREAAGAPQEIPSAAARDAGSVALSEEESRVVVPEAEPVPAPEELASAPRKEVEAAALPEGEPVALPEREPNVAAAELDPVALPEAEPTAIPPPAKPAPIEKPPSLQSAAPTHSKRPAGGLGTSPRASAPALLALVLLFAGVALLALLRAREEFAPLPPSPAVQAETALSQEEESAAGVEGKVLAMVPSAPDPVATAPPALADPKPESISPPEPVKPDPPSAVAEREPSFATQSPAADVSKPANPAEPAGQAILRHDTRAGSGVPEPPQVSEPPVSDPVPDPRPTARGELPGVAVPPPELAKAEMTEPEAVSPRPVVPAAEVPAPVATKAEEVLIFINAVPWAEIEMDGEDLGVTPLGNVPASPGEHHFRIRLPDGREIERTVLVNSDARHFGFSR